MLSARCTPGKTKLTNSNGKEKFLLTDLYGGQQLMLWLNIHSQVTWNADHKPDYTAGDNRGESLWTPVFVSSSKSSRCCLCFSSDIKQYLGAFLC